MTLRSLTPARSSHRTMVGFNQHIVGESFRNAIWALARGHRDQSNHLEMTLSR